MKAFVDYCKDYIIANLPDFEDEEWYGCDITSQLTEEDNNDGGFESEEVSKEYIKNWWNDCADFYEYYDASFGHEEAAALNVFADPIVFMFSMVYWGIDCILSNVSIIDENWNDEIILDEATINTIISEVEKVNKINW